MNYCDCFAHKNSTLADIIPQESYALAELGGGQDGPWPPCSVRKFNKCMVNAQLLANTACMYGSPCSTSL
jgi:hypothetical protein